MSTETNELSPLHTLSQEEIINNLPVLYRERRYGVWDGLEGIAVYNDGRQLGVFTKEAIARHESGQAIEVSTFKAILKTHYRQAKYCDGHYNDYILLTAPAEAEEPQYLLVW